MMDWEMFFPQGTAVAALPGWGNPRLYLPAQDIRRRWAASSLYPAFRPLARCYRLLLRARAASGLLKVRTAQSDGWLLKDFLKDVLPEANQVVVLAGTPGPAQKMTIQIRDAKGRVRGYVKFARGEAARRRLRQEYQLLQRLPTGAGPKALRFAPLADGEAMLITPLEGRALRAKLPPEQGLGKFLSFLANGEPVAAEEHPWLRALLERAGARAEPWLEPLAGRSWPLAVCHGDFAPWNIRRNRDGALSAIDWEYGCVDGFPYVDAAYFVLQTAALIHRWKPRKAASYAAAFLSNHPWPALRPAEAASIVRLAACDAYLKSMDDGESPDAPLQRWRGAVWEGGA